MSLGFYVDILGVGQNLVKGNDARVMGLIYDLGNSLFDLGVYAARQNWGRFFAYQMGDGFMIHFDNVKFKTKEGCTGNANTMLYLALALSYRYLIKYRGMLKIGLAEGDFFGMSGSGFKFISNTNSGNGYRCAEGLIFLLPVSGILLAKAYQLINLHKVRKPFKPYVLLHPEIHSKLSSDLTSSFNSRTKKSEHWWYYDFNRVAPEPVFKIYRDVWFEELEQEMFKNAVRSYNA